MRAKSNTAPDVTLNTEAPPDGTKTVDKGGDVAVWMPPERAGGARAFGDYQPGVVYRVPAAEAFRLVTVKRFRFAAPADQVAVSDYVDGIADAAPQDTKE